MKIQSGHPLVGDVARVVGKSVRFVCDDDRVMFEVHVGTDGKSIEIRAVENCKVGGILYSSRLLIEPNVSNSITVSVARYDDC